MTTRFTILPAASADLDELAAYLVQEDSLELAFRFYDAADATFQQIARMPGIGERRIRLVCV
jgi:plasmid stabilization system protein ParE